MKELNELKLDEIVRIIKNSKNIVVFTGAGISTESGIADFRSEGGLWSRFDPSIYANYYYFLEDPSKFWEMHKELEDIIANAKPNPAHYAIAELENMGKIKAVITQNVDMLHQKAGSGKSGANIFELHGTYGVLQCVKCGKEYDFDKVDTRSVRFPVCKCSGFIKPKVILFEEPLPMEVMEGAMNACMHADCFLMVGSSLVVSPANFMPNIAKKNGAKIIFINKESTMMDEIADIFLKGSASEIFTEIIKRLKSSVN
jgi:NAD-dependent deacetylase